MSVNVSELAGGSGGRGNQSQDFELNIASIIDCFVVLITFLLASASFLSIGILDAGISAAGASASNQEPPPINITVELNRGSTFTIKVTGKSSKTVPIAANGGDLNFDALSKELTSIKSSWPTVSAVTLSAQDLVEYKDIIRTMEQVRKVLPAVMLGGF